MEEEDKKEVEKEEEKIIRLIFISQNFKSIILLYLYMHEKGKKVYNSELCSSSLLF